MSDLICIEAQRQSESANDNTIEKSTPAPKRPLSAFLIFESEVSSRPSHSAFCPEMFHRTVYFRWGKIKLILEQNSVKRCSGGGNSSHKSKSDPTLSNHSKRSSPTESTRTSFARRKWKSLPFLTDQRRNTIVQGWAVPAKRLKSLQAMTLTIEKVPLMRDPVGT